MADELVDIVDEQGVVLRQAMKSEAHVHKEVKLGPEADTYEHFTFEELKTLLREDPNSFGDAYYFELEQFYPDYLPEGYKNRWLC